MVQLDARKRVVLRAVVEEYIRSAEPVGSGYLSLRERLGVSPATIRGEMAALEEAGLLTHPHTSAGRTPTDRGYRVYVDILLDAGPLPAADRQAIRRRLDQAASEPSGAADEAIRVLAVVTQYTSVVAAPGLQQQTFHSLHLVPLDGQRALAVVATHSGGFQGHMIELPEGTQPRDLEQLSRAITERLQGCRVSELSRERLEQVVGEATRHQRLLEDVGEWLRRNYGRAARSQIRVEGARHLLREPEFRRPEAATQVLDALEERSVLADVLAAAPEHGVWVSIGAENRRAELRGCSLVMAPYRAGGAPAGTVGIVGPTRMRYRHAVAAVQYVADRLTDTLRTLG
jgi:heat-inducible transcriptional repressor